MSDVQALNQLSAVILKLHKALLEYQQQIVEKESGKRMTPYEMLGAALNDERFSWLKPLSQMAVTIDLAAENGKDAEAHALEAANSPAFDREAIKKFWENPPEDFRLKMIQALQKNPDISFLFSEARMKASSL